MLRLASLALGFAAQAFLGTNVNCKLVISVLQGWVAIEIPPRHETNATSNLEFCGDSSDRSGE